MKNIKTHSNKIKSDQVNERIAIVVGNGDLSTRIVDVALKQDLDFIVAGIKGNSPKQLVNSHEHFWFYMGEVADFVTKLKIHNVKKILFVGSINRPSLLNLKLDSLGKKIVQEYFSKITGDDSLLAMVIKEMESYGFEIIGVQDIDNSIFAEKQVYTKVVPSQEQMVEIEKSFNLAKELSVFDIGQSLIFQQNMVIAVEAVEGTAKMIKRSKKLIKRNTIWIKLAKIFFSPKGCLSQQLSNDSVKKDKIEGAFLLKIKKANQETRVDLPTIGDKTIEQVYKAGLVGIVIEAGSTIILNKQKAIDLANQYGLFIIAL